MEKLEQTKIPYEIVPSRLLIDSRTTDPCDSNFISKPEYQLPREYPFGSMNGFPTLSEVYESLDLMADLYPNLVSRKAKIGNFRTQDGNNIFFVKISDFVNIDEAEPEILYTALHHAREPLSMSQMLFYMWYLLENYESNPEIKKLVDSRMMYFIPCVNPDGYLYNEETNPRGQGFWRKNRKEMTEGIGVDLNRNYGYQWGYNDIGSSKAVESEVFRGPYAFSEIETQALKFFCETHDIKIAMNYHSHGDILIIPWGYNNLPTSDSLVYMAMARQFTTYNNFRVGSTFSTLNYEVNGVSDDWMYGNRKIFAFTPEVGYAFWPELRDITAINQSTQYMNIMSAWNAGSCAQMKDIGSTALEGPDGVLEIVLQRTGLESNLIQITNQISPQGIIVLDQINPMVLTAGEQRILRIPYRVLPGAKIGDAVQIQLNLITGDYQQTLQLAKVYMGQSLWKETCEDLDFWVSPSGSTLSLTSEKFSSAPSSFTDSPGKFITESKDYRMTTAQEIDLRNAKYAYLSYRVRHDLDKEVDFAQIKISDDGISFDPICGKYTVKGSAFQDLDKPIYTGKQDQWVSEWVNLNSYLGKRIKLQLFVVSGFSETPRDGFYIDDIKVYSDLISADRNIQIDEWMLFPQPASREIFISGNISDYSQFQIISSTGAKWDLNSAEIKGSSLRFPLPDLSSGLYFLKAYHSSGAQRLQKFSIQR